MFKAQLDDKFVVKKTFLDGSTHLYMRLCPSVRWMVRPMDGPSVTSYFRLLEMDNFLNEIIGADQL